MVLSMRMRPFLWFAAASAAAVAVACATGTVAEDDAGEVPIEEEDSGVVTPVRDSATPPQKDAASPTDAGTGDSGPTVDGGGDGGTDGGTGQCVAPNTCVGGIMMTPVSGDKNADTSTQTGSTSRWLKIRVSEDDSNLVDGKKLQLKVTLTSPPGTNFDLRLYLAGDGSGQKCPPDTPDRTSNVVSGQDTASLEWGEGFFPNGSSDDRTVSIEVVHVSGTCTTGQNWTLLAEGNKL
jgi:hypothetical protein